MTDPKSRLANDKKPSFGRRISLAFGSFFRTFSDADYAARIDNLSQNADALSATTPPAEEPSKTAPAVLRDSSPDAALQLLSLLQREARLIDFSMEDLTNYSDAEVGAAARVVHQGCQKLLNEHFTITPVREENEGSSITLNDGFDAAAIRLTGNVVGRAPFIGSLTHRGWRATAVRLPKLSEKHDTSIIAPAEVEL